MKPLNNRFTPPDMFSQAIINHPTSRQHLIMDLMLQLHPLDLDEFTRKVHKVLSKYDIKLCDTKSIVAEIPENIVGKTVKISYAPGEAQSFNFEGDVVQILYRDTAYDIITIQELFNHTNLSKEQKEMMKSHIYEETKPKIYHRLVLNDKIRGILIIPYLTGVNIEQE